MITMIKMNNEVSNLPISKRLTFRILMTTMIGLALTLMAIAYTLLLSWQLEGGAAAINEAGSLRVRSYRIAIVLEHSKQASAAQEELRQFNATLADLQTGDPKRPLFLPTNPEIRRHMRIVRDDWEQRMQVLASRAMQQTNSNLTLSGQESGNDFNQPSRAAISEYALALPSFVEKINTLVSLVENELSEKTTWLRLCQTSLIFLSLAASVALLYLLYLWIIVPMNQLQAGINRMSKDDLDVRLPIETDDEFGELTQGFNHMADHIQMVHKTLEVRVLQKTEKLQSQNHEMSTLYEIAGFLAGPHAIEELCRGFLHRIMQRIHAQGGTVRILDSLSDQLHITVHEGISEKMVEEEHCIKTDDCLCGAAVNQGIIFVRDFRQLSLQNTQHKNQQKRYRCEEEGFFSIAVFQIVALEQVIGSFSLHFSSERVISGEERRLLEILGKNLGVAIENQRLIAKEKEFAVSQERNLLAQGLHDSIAQGLNFLNLQVQMLDDSLQRNNLDEIREIAPLLQAGVSESYEDVRELLLNFRTRLQENNLESEMRNVLNKFKRQSGVHTEFSYAGNGAPLAPEQQLQVLFILQEALSNVRKHAQASSVWVSIENNRDFKLSIRDDGQGFSDEIVQAKGDAHVGLHIMRERASRLAANFNLHSVAGSGTTLTLHLADQERMVA